MITKKEILKVYNENGLNGLYAYMRKNGIKYEKEIFEFGLDDCRNSCKNCKYKKNWLNEKTDKNVFRFHYYSIGIKSRKTGYNYNIIRGIEITIS